MKLNRNLTALVIVGAGIGAWLLMRGDDPVSTAKVKCEHHIEALTGYDLSIGEVADMRVIGDVYSGTVQASFSRSGTRKFAECVFEAGATKRVAVDGKVLAGR